MNREIKFRGLTYYGVWKFGFLGRHQNGDGSYRYYIQEDVTFLISAERQTSFEVRGETVGQFTGLKDKNGVDIYEGDIVKHHTFVRETHVIATVSFEIQAGAYWAKWNEKVDGRIVNRYKEIIATFSDGETYGSELFEVIGNIHQNPELLPHD